jgi:cytidyltransferase-like protein
MMKVTPPITTLESLIPIIRSWQAHDQRVVLVTGVFDILHDEHRLFFTKAKALGQKLIVGIETDHRVKAMKGPSRPINPEQIRLKQLHDIPIIDAVFLLPVQFNQQQDWVDFMTKLKPDIYAVSSHTKYLENKRTICAQTGVTFIIAHQHNPTVSTTKIINAGKMS